MLTEQQLIRYSRNILVPSIGLKGQQKLLNSKVLVIGAGGLGAPAALYLAAAGVGTIGIADFDSVDISNLQRQIIHYTSDIGREKTESAQEKMEKLNPDIRVVVHKLLAAPENIDELLAPYQFIIDATDNFDSKFLINHACVKSRKPYSHAGILQLYGQTFTWIPDSNAFCLRCVLEDPLPPGSTPTCREAGVLGSVAGVMGTIQATECLKYLLGCGELLVGRLLSADLERMEFRTIDIKPAEHCPVCSPDATAGSPRRYEIPSCRRPGRD